MYMGLKCKIEFFNYKHFSFKFGSVDSACPLNHVEVAAFSEHTVIFLLNPRIILIVRAVDNPNVYSSLLQSNNLTGV